MRFIGSTDTGERAANLLTLVSTAHRNDLEVWAYLKYALDQILAGSTDYEPLRPDLWKLSVCEMSKVVSDTRAYKQFGNAVVPLVAHAIAKQIVLTMQWQRDSVS